MTRRLVPVGAATLAVWCAAGSHEAGRPAHAAAPTDAPSLPVRLVDTGLYVQGRIDRIDPRNRPFVPQYTLWSDGLGKSRWAYLPEGQSIDAADEWAWRFPAGTKLWKEFTHAGRKVETRILWKASEASWIYGSYVWNEDGTDAVLAVDGVRDAVEITPNRRHSIPSQADCAACHGAPAQARPLGFNALQLSPDRDPLAIHGEAHQPGMVTLADLRREGLLNPAGAAGDAPPRIRTRSPATRAALGYLAVNCGVCHDGSGEIAALGPVLRLRDLVEDGDAVARSLLGQRTSWQVPGVAEGQSVLVDPVFPERSAILARMRSRSPSSQMPPLGTVVRDQHAIDAITRWIAADLARAH